MVPPVRRSVWILPNGVGAAHKRMARGGQELPKVSSGPAMPYPLTPCRRATPETASWVAHPQSGRPAVVFYPFGHPMLYAYGAARAAMSAAFVSCDEFPQLRLAQDASRGVRRAVSKGVEDGRRLLALQAGHP
jgi:hypothetical protein